MKNVTMAIENNVMNSIIAMFLIKLLLILEGVVKKVDYFTYRSNY
jgi:hypothetical protein